jgi:hypothetical protein
MVACACLSCVCVPPTFQPAAAPARGAALPNERAGVAAGGLKRCATKQSPQRFSTAYVLSHAPSAPALRTADVPGSISTIHVFVPFSCASTSQGDSFDFSVVLASLLLGAGYNAFVVVGGWGPFWGGHGRWLRVAASVRPSSL